MLAHTHTANPPATALATTSASVMLATTTGQDTCASAHAAASICASAPPAFASCGLLGSYVGTTCNRRRDSMTAPQRTRSTVQQCERAFVGRGLGWGGPPSAATAFSIHPSIQSSTHPSTHPSIHAQKHTMQACA
eukprot:363289-Chlamydomonas_euryale.AAC.5